MIAWREWVFLIQPLSEVSQVGLNRQAQWRVEEMRRNAPGKFRFAKESYPVDLADELRQC